MYQCAEDEFAESWDYVGCWAQGKQLKQKPELEVYGIRRAEEYMTRTGSMQLAKIQTSGILRVGWPARIEGESGDYKILKWQVNVKERGRGWWVQMYARVIKPERHSRTRYKEKQCDFDGGGEAG